MAEENVLRTRLEFIFGDVKDATKAVEDVRQALNSVAPSAQKAESAMRGWSESMQSHWAKTFQMEEQKASRSYSNLSVNIDAGIKARQKEASSFGAVIKNQMEETAAREKATGAVSRQIEQIKALNTVRRAESEAQKTSRSNIASNLSYIPENTPSPRVGASFGFEDPQIYQRDAHVQTYKDMNRQKEMASQQTALYNQYLYDEEKAANKATAATNRMAEPSLPRLRYALYDVSTTLNIAAVALAAFSTGSIVAASRFESAFTNVDRTIEATSFQLGFIRDQLLVLSREIPMSFQEITQIASLGGQLGVAQSDLAGFTETVAQFAAVTNVSIDQAAQSFGSLGELLNVPTGEFQNLGSAITLVGINSVATETEILSVANQIAGVSAAAGLSAEFVVGLSSALASLRLPPEQSRGALTKLFQQVNRAAAEGGEAIERFAGVLGVSTAEADRLARTDMEGFFNKFIEGLSNLDAQELTTTLDALGLSELRITNTLTRLAGNFDLVGESLGLASEGYESGAVLAGLYAKRVDDIAAKFQILLNGIQELAATAGTALLPILGPIIDGFTDFVNMLSDILSTDTGKIFSSFAIGGAALLAILFSVTATVALAVASLAALKTAMLELGIVSATATTGLRGVMGGMIGVTTATGGASVALKAFRFALIGTGVGIALAALGALAQAFSEVGDNSTMAFNRAVSSTSGLSDAVKADTAAYQQAADERNVAVMASFTEFTVAGEEGANKWDESTQRVVNAAEVLGTEIPDAFFDATGAIDSNTYALGENTRAWFRNQLLQSDVFQQLAGNQEFLDLWKTLGADFNKVIDIAAVDGKEGLNAYFLGLAEQAYASGQITAGTLNTISLQIKGEMDGILGVLSGGKDLFGPLINLAAGLGGSLQLVDFGFGDIAEGADEAGEEGTDALDDIGSSAGGAAARVYTLVDYANDLIGVFRRASDIRFKSALEMDSVTDSWEKLNDRIRDAQNEIAKLTADRSIKEYFLSVAEAYGDELRAGKLRAEIVDLNEKIADTQSDASTELTGNSSAARKNRKTLSDLVNEYQQYIAALAESGADQTTLNAAVNKSKAEFLAQAQALGFSNVQLQPYIASFKDMRTVINNVPRNITVTANTNPALQALNEFVAQARSAGSAAGRGWSDGVNNGLSKTARGIALQNQILEWQRLIGVYISSGNFAGARYLGQSIKIYTQRLKDQNYATGGYTGRGGKYQPAGIVHKGEYVVPKNQVNQSTGLPYANALGQLQSGSRGATSSYANGGMVTGGAMMVSLSPTDRALLRQAGGSGDVVIAVDSMEIARASNKGNKQMVAMGGRP